MVERVDFGDRQRGAVPSRIPRDIIVAKRAQQSGNLLLPRTDINGISRQALGKQDCLPGTTQDKPKTKSGRVGQRSNHTSGNDYPHTMTALEQKNYHLTSG